MVKAVKIQMNVREELRKKLQNGPHLQWGEEGGKRVSKSKTTELEVGRLWEPLTEVEVRWGSSFVGMEVLGLNSR